MSEILPYENDFVDENSSQEIDDFEKKISENLYKLNVMRKTLYKMLNDLNNNNVPIVMPNNEKK